MAIMFARMYPVLMIASCIRLSTSTVQPVIQHEDYVRTTNDEIEIVTDAPENQYYSYSEEFLNCGKIKIEPHHYELLQNSSVYIPIYRELINSRNYVIINESLYVCPPSVIQYSIPDYDEESPIKGILTIVLLTLSCICLGLHLVVFAIVPEYKTLTGKNTASIAACLFVAYTMFLFRHFSIRTISCNGMAAATCYFFLSSFFWMNSFTFDQWISLSTSISILQKFVTRTKESIRYWIYACYSFGVPLIIVGAAVIVDNVVVGNDDFVPVFSVDSCWFQSYKSFIVFFIVPYITLTLLDVLFFLLSIMAIMKLKISSGKHELSPIKRFIVCLRLATATGVPWLIGIIALFAKWDPLWYAFIICSTLQGVYIFAAYNCNKKTLKYLLERFRGKQKSPTTSVTKSVSSPV